MLQRSTVHARYNRSACNTLLDITDFLLSLVCLHINATNSAFNMPGYNRLQQTIFGTNFVEMVQIQGTLLRLCVHAAVRCTQLFPAACKICKKIAFFLRNECTGGKLPAATCQTRLRRMWLLAPDKSTRCLKMANKLHGTARSKSPFCFWVGVLTHRDGVRAEWHRSPWQEECYQHFGVDALPVWKQPVSWLDCLCQLPRRKKRFATNEVQHLLH